MTGEVKLVKHAHPPAGAAQLRGEYPRHAILELAHRTCRMCDDCGCRYACAGVACRAALESGIFPKETIDFFVDPIFEDPLRDHVAHLAVAH